MAKPNKDNRYIDRVRNMAVNPFYGAKPLLTFYPKLREIAARVEVPEAQAEDWFRYLGMVYDPRSPMVTEITDIRERKIDAGSMFGVNPGDVPAALMVAFLKEVVRSKEWMGFVTAENMLDELMEELNKPIGTIVTERLDIGSEGELQETTTSGKMTIAVEERYKAMKLKTELNAKMESLFETRDRMLMRFLAGDEEAAKSEKVQGAMGPTGYARMFQPGKQG